MCFSLSTKYSFSIWKLFFLEFPKYRRLHLPVNAPQTLKAFPNVPTTSLLWNSPFKYLLIQNLHLLLWGSPRCFCGSQYASEGIFANLAHTFDWLEWEIVRSRVDAIDGYYMFIRRRPVPALLLVVSVQKDERKLEWLPLGFVFKFFVSSINVYNRDFATISLLLMYFTCNIG